MSSFRSQRSQLTLDNIKNPQLRTRRSIERLVIDIDDKVLNFKKHGVDIEKALKRRQRIFEDSLEPP